MDPRALFSMFASGMALFAVLLQRGPRPVKATAIVIAVTAAINCAGAVGLAWWAMSILIYDGVLIEELAICAGSIALLAAITSGALALDRRGRTKTAIALLVVAALPTAAIFGFLLYLDAHPIAWH